MVWVHVGNVDIHLKIVTDHECLYVFVHNAAESQKNLWMVFGFVEFLKAGSVSNKAGSITSIALDYLVDSVVKLLNFLLSPGNHLVIR